MKRSLLLLLVTAGVLAAAAIPAGAQVKAGSGEFEVYGGWEEFGADVDGDMVIGLRAGYNINPKWGIGGQVGWVTMTETFNNIDYDIDVMALDLDVEYHFNPESKMVGLFFIGPGWVWADADAADSEYNDGVSFNVGLAGKLHPTEHFYFRPDVRYRYLNEGGGNNWEATIGFGWTWGGK